MLTCMKCIKLWWTIKKCFGGLGGGARNAQTYLWSPGTFFCVGLGEETCTYVVKISNYIQAAPFVLGSLTEGLGDTETECHTLVIQHGSYLDVHKKVQWDLLMTTSRRTVKCFCNRHVHTFNRTDSSILMVSWL